MILFENMKLISWDPPAVTGPVDIVACGSREDLPAGARPDASRAGTILDVGQNLSARFPEARRVASGGYISPGLVLSHTHLYSALARGMMVSIQPSKDFAQQLAHLWWRLDRAIDLPILESSGLAGLVDAAFSGVTSVVDHHAGPEAIDGSLTVLRGAYETIGLRGLLCYETTDRNGMAGARAGLAENIRFAREIDADRAAGGRPLVDGAIGGHAGFTVGEETLEALGDAVRTTGRGIHIHLGEDKYDAVDSRHRFGLDLVERMDKAGCLTPKGIVGHGVWLTDSEVEILNGRDAFLAHNARSNMNNAVGYNGLLTRFKNVILGTDGMSADMLEEFKFAVFRHRETAGPWWPDNFLACMDRGNRLLERYFGPARPAGGVPEVTARFGVVKPGAKADLVVWDYDPPTPFAGANLAGHLAFGLGSRSVRSVAVNGDMIIENGQPRFDRAAIMAKAREQAARLWKRMEER